MNDSAMGFLNTLLDELFLVELRRAMADAALQAEMDDDARRIADAAIGRGAT